MHVQVSLTIEISATASLTEMEQQIQEAGQQAMRAALKQAISHWEDQRPSCPHCGEKQRRLEGTVRRSIATTTLSLPGVLASLVSSQRFVRRAERRND